MNSLNIFQVLCAYLTVTSFLITINLIATKNGGLRRVLILYFISEFIMYFGILVFLLDEEWRIEHGTVIKELINVLTFAVIPKFIAKTILILYLTFFKKT